MPTVTVVFQPPGSREPGGVVAQPLSADGRPVGEITASGFKTLGGMVVWSGPVLKEAAAVKFNSTTGWEHTHPLPREAVAPHSPSAGVLSQDTGGRDALLYRDRLGRPVGGAAVSVYSCGADSGVDPSPKLPPDAKPVAQTVTTRDGRWTTRVAVPAGQFIIVFEKPGLFGPDAVRLAVPERGA